jgi:[acyl-carrier-protein] S-malonyltransferase
MSYAIYKLLENNDIKPDFLAGFSLGEITSFAAAEIINFKDTLNLISIRGNVMQKACDSKPGAMYSIIGAENELIEEVCDHISKTTGYVTPANYNCPKQIVISGEINAAKKAAEIFIEKKFRAVKLNVAGAYHSRLMQYAQNELIEFLKTLDFKHPKIQLYSNLTGKKFECGENIKSFMIDYIPKQMSNPVLFNSEIKNINSMGCDMFIEIGAGSVLSGFVKKTCENAKFINISDMQTFEEALKLFHVKQFGEDI